MIIHYEIRGTCTVPEGTRSVPGTASLFQLPSGETISVHPVVETASGPEADDHRDLSYNAAVALGVLLDLYDRECEFQSTD